MSELDLTEAVEAMARVLLDEYCDFDWDEAPERKREYYRSQAGEFLDVVAPILERQGREKIAQEIEAMPSCLFDEGWEALARQAIEADYPRRWVDDRRKRDDFTTATIECAYQYGYRAAAAIARGSSPSSSTEEKGQR